MARSHPHLKSPNQNSNIPISQLPNTFPMPRFSNPNIRIWQIYFNLRCFEFIIFDFDLLYGFHVFGSVKFTGTRALASILIGEIGIIDQFVMKFLECAALDRLNDFLDNLNMGERTIKGCLEAYSCKHAGTDKKLSISLETEILDYLGKSSDTDSSSPDQTLLTRNSRKTLVYLVLTLYHIYPDYDFSAVKAHQFFAEESWDSFKQIFDTYMCEASKARVDVQTSESLVDHVCFRGIADSAALECERKDEWAETLGGTSLLDTLFKALDEVVKLADCEIYGYVPDSEADPLQESGAIWSFNFLFYNRKLKRIVTFRFSCFSNLIADGLLVDEMLNEYDEEIFTDMDI
ncbi:hypothetical protein V8G54_030208 [Vigna mungo]|uniref:Repressor of RNA polymerase III transcription n=1 Tax=Vigna mungo TaxID=3915 RepID=A0AAQ3MV74_VIGMU